MLLHKLLLICTVVAVTYGKSYSYGMFDDQEDECGIGLDFKRQGSLFETLYYKNVVKKDTDSDEFYLFNLPDNITDYKIEIDPYGDNNGYLMAYVSEDNTTVTIKPTPSFAEMEEHIYSQESNRKIELNIQFTFYCGEDKVTEFEFIQPISDTNNHDPTFNRQVYEYRFGMPIRKGATLTDLLEIYAVDIDMSNERVKFGVVNGDDEIEISNGDSYDGTDKIHYARLKTKKVLEANTKKEYQINVTDVGNSKKTTEATVKIIID